MSGDWRGKLWTLLVIFCVVIIRWTETFWSPCIRMTKRWVGYVALWNISQMHILWPENPKGTARFGYPAVNMILKWIAKTWFGRLGSGVIWQVYRSLPGFCAQDMSLRDLLNKENALSAGTTLLNEARIITVCSPLKLPQFREWRHYGKCQSDLPRQCQCPYLAPTSRKGHDTCTLGPLYYELHDEVKLDPRLTKHSWLRSDIREQLSSRVQLSGELAGILKLQPVVLLHVSLLHDGRTGERCLLLTYLLYAAESFLRS
jgi:hypothetical protein